MTNTIGVVRDGAVLALTFNRPDKKNALTRDMYDLLADEIEAAENDLSLSAILFAGTGGNFTAGNDLADFRDVGQSEGPRPAFRFINALANSNVPMVAAVDGVAVGVGMTMLLHCDLVFATADARLQMPFVNLGLVPEAGSSYLLPKMLGHNRAAELLLGGEPVTGQRALELGIVNRVCGSDALHEVARRAALSIAAKPPRAVRQTKRLLKGDRDQVVARIDSESAVFSEQLASAECAEAISAFFEKRPPDFSKC